MKSKVLRHKGRGSSRIGCCGGDNSCSKTERLVKRINFFKFYLNFQQILKIRFISSSALTTWALASSSCVKTSSFLITIVHLPTPLPEGEH